MFNPNPKLQLIPIPGQSPCIVIDDFLLAPELLVDGAARFRTKFGMAPNNAFPGLEMRMPEDFSARVNEFFIQHVRKLLGARRTLGLFTRLSMVTLKPHELRAYQRICHVDTLSHDPTLCYAASVLYLFKNPELGGTSFYTPKISKQEIVHMYSSQSEWVNMTSEDCTRRLGAAPNYLLDSNDMFELVCTVPPAWNRVLFYDGGIFHSSHIQRPDLLSGDPLQGRLTLNGFFTCRRSA